MDERTALCLMGVVVLLGVRCVSGQGFDVSGIRKELDVGGWNVCQYCDLCANIEQCWEDCQDYMCQFCPYMYHCFTTCQTDCWTDDPVDTWFTWARLFF